MYRLLPKKRSISRVRQICDIAAMSGGVILAAILITLTINARIQIITLSDETIQLTARLDELKLLERNKLSEYLEAYSLESIEESAEKMGMIPPSGLRMEFIDSPQEDLTVVFAEEKDKALDKPKMIWEYFGWHG